MNSKNIAVLASGRGSNFQAILEKINDGFIPARVVLCISNNPRAGVLEIARENNIPAEIINPKAYADSVVFNTAILDALEKAATEFIILAGYLKLLGPEIVKRFSNRIINIHPALLPSFGGKGMYGHHVHQAVYDRGARISGATVHLVNDQYDAGPIVLQKSVDLDAGQTAEEIAETVLKIEHEIFPMAVKYLVEERLVVNGLRVTIKE